MPIGGMITNFPQGFASGISVRGMPLVQTQPGSVFWLNNTTVLNAQTKAGSDSNRGSYMAPFATLQFAVSQCKAGNGDIIFVGAGHVERISSATALNLANSGVAIVGLGSGNLRPQFILDTAATSVINISGDNISFQNCRFTANFANITKLFNLTHASMTGKVDAGILTITAATTGTLFVGNMINGTNTPANVFIRYQISGTAGGVGTYQLSQSYTAASTTITTTQKNFAVDNCDIADTSAALNFLALFTTGALANAADGLQITNNTISLLTASGAVNLFTSGANADRVRITDNYYAAATTSTGAVIVLAATVMTNFLLLRNIFVLVNAAATATGYLITTSATTGTGFINQNYDFCLANTTYASSLAVSAASGIRFGQNYHTRTADKSSGAILPTPDA